MTFTFALFCLHQFSNITQIMKEVLQYNVHQLPGHSLYINNGGPRYDTSPVFSLNCMGT